MSMNALEIQRVEDAPAPVVTPMAMIDRALALNANPDTLERLFALQEQYEKNEARKAFDAAMSDAKGEIGPIRKNRKVDFTSQKGRTNYRHEDLAEIARTIDPILRKHGLSYRFRTTAELNAPVSVTCIVSHRMGHSEENILFAGRDESGNKNSIQAVGSTITYLQRYTLKAALGLAASNDDDGRTSEQPADDGPIPEADAEKLREMIAETGTDIAKFCEYMGVASIVEIQRSQYKRAHAALSRKAKVTK